MKRSNASAYDHCPLPLRLAYAVVTCEIKLFHYYFSLRRSPSEIILFQRVETCLKLFRNYFTGLLQLTNTFHMFIFAELILKNKIILELLQRG